MRAFNNIDHKWVFWSFDPITFVTTYQKFGEDGLIYFCETVPEWLKNKIAEENKAKAKLFTENGGWAGAKHGAVVANIPNIIEDKWKRAAGWNPLKGSWYDRDKYNKFLNDSDYSDFRTGGGRVGKHATDAGISKAKLKKIIQQGAP